MLEDSFFRDRISANADMGLSAAAAVLSYIIVEQPVTQQHTGADAPQQVGRRRAQDIS